MTSKNIILSLGDIFLADENLTADIGTRCYARRPMTTKMVTPMITMWLDDSNMISDLPAGNYQVEIGIWNNMYNNGALEKISDIKDRTKVLVNNKPGTINSQGHNTKVRTFDFISGVLSDEYLGELKLWYIPCIYNCIIGD